MGMFESCCGGARASDYKENKKKSLDPGADDERAAHGEAIDEDTDGIALGNGWQRWIDFDERRYYYSKGGTTTWDMPSPSDLVELSDAKK